MFKKNKKQTETIKEPKEKKVRTVKVGTHKKTVIALWVVLIASVSFGVYKNFTAIDQHTTHEKEIIELRLQDTNGIENFVKNFAKILGLLPDQLLQISSSVNYFNVYQIGSKVIGAIPILFTIYLICYFILLPLLYRIYKKSELNS